MSADDAYEELRQKRKDALNPDKKEYEQPAGAKTEKARFKGTQSSLVEADPSSLRYPFAVSGSEVGPKHKLPLKEVSICLSSLLL